MASLTSSIMAGDANPNLTYLENLTICEMEPSAENLVVYIRGKINKELPDHLRLAELKLYETKDSYAHWVE